VKTIELGHGRVALVDAADYDGLRQHRWHCVNRRAARTGPDGSVVYMSRQIMDAPAGSQVDHINGDILDNRRSNLRLCTAGENRCNAKRHRNKRSSRYKGVYRERGRERWRAIIGREYRTISLGTFATEEEAALAYNAAAERYHGEFARLNNIAGNEFRNARQSGFLGREPLAAGSEGQPARERGNQARGLSTTRQ
jgi:hypothetical protein